MTGPRVDVPRPLTRVLSPDEFDQAQHLTAPALATMSVGGPVKTTTGPTRILSPDEFDQAQTMTGPAIKTWQLPALPPVARDVTRTPMDPNVKGTPLKPFDIKDPTTYANPVLRQIVFPAMENPLTTIGTLAAAPIAAGISPLAGLAVGGAMVTPMVNHIAQYGWQQALASQMSPEVRKEFEADPERYQGEAAAMQAVMLGLGPLLHVTVKGMRGPDFGEGMMEAGSRGLHEYLADPEAAMERTAPFEGELNAQHAKALELGAATTRIPQDVPRPAGFEPTTTGVRLKTNPRAPAGLVVPETVTPGKIKPVGTEPAAAPLEARAALDQSVRDYQAQTAAQDQAEIAGQLSKARAKAARLIEQADRFRPSRRPKPFPETPQGAQIIGAAAARHELPNTANPYHPDSPLAVEWQQGHEAGQLANKNLAETGFATMGSDEPSAVMLPSSGAGRAGSTVDAVARAKALIGPDALRKLADAELARRGDPDIPEARMAAMEQVARDVASRGAAPETAPSYPEGFSMGGALGDNRVPGAAEVPKVARGSDPATIPDGATPETIALANALKPSRYRTHTSEELAQAALDAQHELVRAEQGYMHSAYGSLMSERGQADLENRGVSISDVEEGSTLTAERMVARAKSKLAQIEREFAMRGVTGDALAEVIQGAKEAEAERAGMQSDVALAMHMGADDPFGESPAPSAAPVADGTASARGLAAVEGTGDMKVRGLSAGVQENAVAHKLTETLGDLPEYRTLSMQEQARGASELLASDPALARRIALGEVPPPPHLLPESVFTAVENKAIAEGDVATLRELATGKLTSDATTMGQRIRALGERDPESPVGAMQQVADARARAVKNVPKALDETVAAIRAQLEQAQIKPEVWADFINSLRC